MNIEKGRPEDIHQNHEHVTMFANFVGANSPVAILKIPAGKVFRLGWDAEVPSLVLKLVTSTGVEIDRASKVFLAWKRPVGETIYYG